jgi:SAM-dependent MidA family methyltransferase
VQRGEGAQSIGKLVEVSINAARRLRALGIEQTLVTPAPAGVTASVRIPEDQVLKFEQNNGLPAPAADALAASGLLVAHVVSQIEAAGGWIPFDRYMDLALYAPGLGYYAGGATKLGAAGDFITAPEMTPLFARALAAQIAQVTAASAPQVLEFGAGSGALARDLIAALALRGAPLARYCIVEPSPQLRERQRALLAEHGVSIVEWLDAPPTGFCGAVIANEVLDAMPVKLFVAHGSAIEERGVTLAPADPHGIELAWRDLPAAEPLQIAVAALTQEIETLPDGYVSELPLAAGAWAASLGTWLAQGAAFILDYGFPRREFYHPQRTAGTLMCHYRHRAHTDPLWLPGLNDITAHVDFTTIAERAQDTGLEVLGYTSQGQFLLNCGLLAELPAGRTPEELRDTQAVHRLISEAEMGELFKVLAVGRGLEAPLVGFALGDRSHRL